MRGEVPTEIELRTYGGTRKETFLTAHANIELIHRKATHDRHLIIGRIEMSVTSAVRGSARQ